MTYLSIFLRTAAGIALTVLLAAQTLDFIDKDSAIASGTIVAWGLVGAIIAGLLAVLHAVVASPASTALGKALRSAVQALLGTPLAGAVINSMSDVKSLGNLILPTISATVLAFLVAYLSNRGAVPTVQSNANVGADFAGTTSA